ncbi:bifunctional diaminohydroxyphosphoribosylaminopyrimidine deaminase/5-amino-6-(5-phosphoribosylamino)uracil reductase RibD [Stakelama sp. CBK3Z-3]|uniref:Riboflavin biosynthesis protein RibD n=1 Tax=Stakelama flava TaxID=2860338 RepID=A0ABS6XQ09_9SPHN|nr:bifunctional diaminohydroxyphosphoribosylaminopyrimidine deaminase/5-amino-6-(5-phosphoribosylamino)uracil reductase RibD [Stakelama flava]MBW4331969.1 bifunctional diaminohydroxyphosphoribosylaminopyrimidine deaminase/5-amino-6-(5-phosphoribosylamino)uracil reductase RibD [Stakelama flava]
MGAALSLAERGRGRVAPNPNVGCVIVNRGVVVGRGWTQPGGRPHAEAMALAQAGAAARGATAYVTLEPCAHVSPRGPACSDLLAEAGVTRVVVALRDPDPRTDGKGLARLYEAGIETLCGVEKADARRSMAGFLTRQRFGRPHVTLKLAMSLDGAIAMADGRSKWITGEAARHHAHVERARHEMILVGRGTVTADRPSLDVRLAGLEDRAPARLMLSSEDIDVPPGWRTINAPGDLLTDDLPGDHLLVEGGIETAASFLSADLVDRLLLYRAPILIGDGRTLPGFGLADLADAHGRWRACDSRRLGSDTLDVYERVRR